MKRLLISAIALLALATTAGTWWYYARRSSALHSNSSSRSDTERYLSHAKASRSTPPKDACAKLLDDAYQTLPENSKTRSDLHPIVWVTGVLLFWDPERWPSRLGAVMADFERQYSEALRKLRLVMACSCEDGDCLERDSIIVAHPIETLALIQLLKVSAHEKLSHQQDDLAWDSLRCQILLANILSGRGDKNVAGSCWPHIAETAAMLSARSVAEPGIFGQILVALHEQDLQRLPPQKGPQHCAAL